MDPNKPKKKKHENKKNPEQTTDSDSDEEEEEVLENQKRQDLTNRTKVPEQAQQHEETPSEHRTREVRPTTHSDEQARQALADTRQATETPKQPRDAPPIAQPAQPATVKQEQQQSPKTTPPTQTKGTRVTLPPLEPIVLQPRLTGDTGQQQQQSQIPTIILMRRSQRISSFHPALFARDRHSELNYQTLPVGRDAMVMTCPVCKERGFTMVVNEPKHPRCLITFLLITIPCCCCCWPCVCLPYCMDSCQNANHYCPNCNAYVGTFEN